jgi:acetylornithine deacetylase/succinyl-diaminopimelate desuccinylase-like protein
VDERIKEVASAYAASCVEEELDLLRTLAQIPAPSHHEDARARFVREWLVSQGASDVRIDDANNVILVLGAKSREDYAVFSAHTDVVFPDTDPLPLAEDAERLYAPGVGDDTANLVGLLFAARWFLKRRPRLARPLLVVANSCEEGLGNLAGTRELFRQYAGRITEFTSFDLYLGMHVTSAVGSHRWRVRCTTEGGHSWENFGRDNAIEALCSFIEDLYALELPTEAKTTINVGRFVGGTTVNAIAEEASVLVEYRSASEGCLEKMYGKFVVLVEEHLKEKTRIDVELIGRRPASGGLVPAGQAALVTQADEALRELADVKPIHVESSTDANIPLSLSIPAHTVGAVEGDLLHTREEWIEKASLPRGLAVIMALMLSHVVELPGATELPGA